MDTATPAPAEPAQAAGALPSMAQGRPLVEQELAYHERWSAMASGNRAGSLLNTTIDAGKAGLENGAVQVAGGRIGALAGRLPIPGIGNMLGGVLSGYALAESGGQMLGDIGNAFNWEGKDALEIAADVVAGIKSTADLIGNVANVLSGLAYAFAGVASGVGLLSIAIPALIPFAAALMPHVPTAVSLGRGAGAVAQVSMGISNLISPVPAGLRALHILMSDQDPMRLVAQEDKYKKEMASAVANYSSAAADGALGRRMQQRTDETNARLSRADAPEAPTMRDYAREMNPVNRMVGGIREGVSDFRNNANPTSVRSDFGMEGTGASAQADAKKYMNLAGTRRDLATTRREQAGRDVEQATEQRAIAERANAQAVRADRRASQRRAGRSEHRENARRRREEADAASTREAELQQQAAWRRDAATQQETTADRMVGAGKGEVGNTAGGAYDIVGEKLSAQEPARPDGEPRAVEIPRNERGHVVLPEPPGTLSDVDALQARIRALSRQAEAAGTEEEMAQDVATEADGRTSELTSVESGVAQTISAHAGRAGEHAAAGAKQNELRSGIDTQFAGQQQATARGAGAFEPLLGGARIVLGLANRAPENPLVDVKAVRSTASSFIEAIEGFQGRGDQGKEQQGRAKRGAEERGKFLADAQAARAEGESAGASLQGKVETDRAVAESVAGEATAIASEAGGRRQGLEAELAAARAEHQQKWGALVGWAETHYGIRTAAAQQMGL